VIRRLILNGFGKFRQREFELSGVTVVYGPNEAGKTTFFDALFQALCKPSEAKKAGKDLKARYGSARSAAADTDGIGPIPDEEFMNLYAIREGDLRLEWDKSSEWLDRLKSRLFHGGLDPAELMAEFDKRSSDKANLVHSKELEKAKAAAAKAREELDLRKRGRSDLAAAESRLAEADAALQETRKLRDERVAEAAGLEVETQREDRIAQRQKWTAQLARLEEWEALEASAAGLAPFHEDRSEEWNRLSAESMRLRERLSAEKGKRDQRQEMLAQAQGEHRAARDAASASAARSALAARLGGEAEKALAALREKSGAGLPAWSLAAAALLLMSGAASIALMGGHIRFAAAGICLGLAAAVLWLGGRMGKAASRDRRIRLLAGLKDQWALGAGTAYAAAPGGTSPAAAADVSTLESFHAVMQQAARERETLEAREKESLRRSEDQADALAKLDAAIRDLKDEEDAAHRQERDWLARHGVVDFGEYLQKASRSRQVREEAAKRRTELEAMAQGSDWNLDSLRRDLRRKLQDLDEAGVGHKGLDDAALQRQRQRRKELQNILEDLGRQEGGLIAQKERLAGEISGAMGKLAPEIVAWEDRLAEAVKDVRARELDKQAAALARDIFKEIGDGADLMLQGLSGDIQEMLGSILPQGRSVSLMGLEDRQIQVQDAAGGVRSLDHLSTGTRHAMVLAAKLALARKHRKGPGILVLDEPFLAMDEERVGRALELLRDFHARNGWQIILLTKETHLVEKVRTLFPDPRVLDLSLPDL
jgi:hypothetical protein